MRSGPLPGEHEPDAGKHEPSEGGEAQQHCPHGPGQRARDSSIRRGQHVTHLRPPGAADPGQMLMIWTAEPGSKSAQALSLL